MSIAVVNLTKSWGSTDRSRRLTAVGRTHARKAPRRFDWVDMCFGATPAAPPFGRDKCKDALILGPFHSNPRLAGPKMALNTTGKRKAQCDPTTPESPPEILPKACLGHVKPVKNCRKFVGTFFLFDSDACGCAHATRRRRVRPTREVVCRVPLEALTADDSTTGEHPSTLCMLLRSGIANFTSSPTGSQRWSSDSALAQGFPHAASIRCPLVFADPCPAYGVH